MKRLAWTVGDVVRKLRDAREWTQDDLAAHAGLNKQTVNRLEIGLGDRTMTTIEKIAAAFEIRPEDLFALIPREPPATSELTRERDQLWALIPEEFCVAALQALRRFAQLGVQEQVTRPPSPSTSPATPETTPRTPGTTPPKKQ
jgi:transcriptional regulator with XRE-family HTH domain